MFMEELELLEAIENGEFDEYEGTQYNFTDLVECDICGANVPVRLTMKGVTVPYPQFICERCDSVL